MLKRFFDLVLIFCFFIIWFPLTCIIVITSFIFNGRPIFFFQYRGGYKNKKIKIIKFRTIDKKGNINAYSNFLRFYKLDELPQIINILKGDMSLIGPRPLHYEYKKLYKKNHLKRFNVMPGITGWTQVKSENNIKWSKKFDLDLWYVENQNFFLDLKILLLTLKKLSFSIFKNNKKSLPVKRFNGKN